MRFSMPVFLLLAMVLSVASPTALADVVNDMGTGLAFAGFDVRGNRNPLSGGADLLITNTFNGSPFDFGAGDIAFQGPISLQVSTGGRLLSHFDLSLTTAIDNRSQPTPLSYVFNYNAGGQSTQVTGSALVNADFSLDGLGFYKLSIDLSSRQSVNRNGQNAGDQTQIDSDLGPITISGNILIDAVALITDPLFERAGRSNPFASVSPAVQLIDADPAARQQLLKALKLSGDSATGSGVAFGRDYRSGLAGWPVELSNAQISPNGRAQGLAVPEPPVIALLLLGIPAILGRLGLRKRR